MDSQTVDERRAEAYRRAAAKKHRYELGIVVGVVFSAVGAFVSEVVVFGGIIVIAISAANLWASVTAEKRLRSMDRAAPAPARPGPKPAREVEMKNCSNCGKRIPVESNFCERCGKKQ